MAKMIDRLRAILYKASGAVPGSRVRIVENLDGSIDGEIVAPVERGDSFEAKFEAIEEVLREDDISPNASFSVGIRFPASGADHDRSPFDTSRSGLAQVFSRYYHDIPDAVAVTERIGENLRKKKFRKAEQMIFRVHWNRNGMKPPRESK